MDGLWKWFWQPSAPFEFGLLLASFLFAATTTWLAIVYARRRRLIDLPGPRRSHATPTPRGGGMGIVVAVLFGIAVTAHFFGSTTLEPVRVAAAIVFVAAIGWLDDHRGAGIVWRLLAHFLAIAIVLWPLMMDAVVRHEAAYEVFTGSPGLNAFLALMLCLAFVWSINLHNFMDGINGLLATQVIFVFLSAAMLCRDPLATALLPLWAAAAVGFLPFNFPRARVFMGDVGSGVLGLLVAVAVFLQFAAPSDSAFSGVIACSAFVTDATCTLFSRMLRGRRWYSAHREHLYQWLARSGFSHTGVVALYMSWNLLIVAPVLYFASRLRFATYGSASSDSAYGFVWAIVVYALAAVVWILGKRWCIHQARNAAK